MAIKVFTSKLLRKNLSAESVSEICADFKEYKLTGIAPKKFGRDAPYDRPPSAKEAELWHMHLQEANGSNNRWYLRVIQHDRVSDTCLVYCQGEKSKDNYLLITILTNVHIRQNKTTFMMELAEIAEGFKKLY